MIIMLEKMGYMSILSCFKDNFKWDFTFGCEI